MSVISSIIDQVNTQYSNVVFADPAYDAKKIVGLAWPYPEKKGADTLIKIVPAIYQLNVHGDASMIDLNDANSLLIYHKITSNTYQLLQKGATGDDYLQQQLADITMTVCALRNQLLMQPDDLNDIILKGLPTGISAMPGIIRCTIIPVATDFDFIGIVRREFSSVDYFLKPNQMLFQVKYRISLLIDPKCLSLGVYSGTVIWTEDSQNIITET